MLSTDSNLLLANNSTSSESKKFQRTNNLCRLQKDYEFLVYLPTRYVVYSTQETSFQHEDQAGQEHSKYEIIDVNCPCDVSLSIPDEYLGF